MSTTRELICIVCPASCTLRVHIGSSDVVVEGAMCNRGVEFARKEVLNPVRHVMSVVKVRGGNQPVVPVITSRPVPKDCIWLIMKKLATLEVEAPVEIGQLILKDVCGVNVKATRRVERA